MVAFRCYESKTVGVDRWLATQRPEIRAEVDGALELLQPESSLRGLPAVKPLRGKCKGLTEIKIDFSLGDAEIHIRILGYEGPGRSEFTLVWPFAKRGGADYGPACRSAQQRKRGIERYGKNVRPCTFPAVPSPSGANAG
jgi:hypothetical protein